MTQFKYSQLEQDSGLIPTRKQLSNQKMTDIVMDNINNGNPFVFCATTYEEIEWNNSNYHVILYGNIPGGASCAVVIRDIPINFDVLDQYDEGVVFKNKLLAFIQTNNIKAIITEDKAYNYNEFRPNMSIVYRLSFQSGKDHDAALTAFYAHNDSLGLNNDSLGLTNKKDDYYLAFDDKVYDYARCGGSYFRKYAREFKIQIAGWNRVSKAACNNAIGTHGGEVKPYTVGHSGIRCDVVVCTYAVCVEQLTEERINIIKNNLPDIAKGINSSGCLTCYYDIETYSEEDTGELPPIEGDWCVFSIGITIAWDTVPIARFIIQEYPFDHPPIALETDIKDEAIEQIKQIGVHDYSIVCDNELQVVKAFIAVLHKMQPDVISAFNGAAFDMPYMFAKMSKLNLLVDFKNALAKRTSQNEKQEAIEKYGKKSEDIKITADLKDKADCVIQFPGVLDIDMRIIFMKMNEKAEVGKGSSLAFYLKINKLPSKVDMPYKLMFRVYEMAKALFGRIKNTSVLERNFNLIKRNYADYVEGIETPEQCVKVL